MPHKRNPWRLENVSGLARVVRGYAVAALENLALWHERDISNSSVERVVLPDASLALDFMLQRLAGLVETLVVYPERMRENLELSRGLVFSGALLLELARRALSREDAYRLVQRHAMETWERGGDFRERVLARPRDRRGAGQGGDRPRLRPRPRAAPRGRDLRAHAREEDAVKALVYVTLKPDVLDPQGEAIRKACRDARLRRASRSVRQGKLFEIELDAASEAEARRLLARALGQAARQHRDRGPSGSPQVDGSGGPPVDSARPRPKPRLVSFSSGPRGPAPCSRWCSFPGRTTTATCASR